MAFIFKIQIKDITHPPVWRRIIIPEHFSFLQFHEVIQAAFGWQDYHLFQFCDKEYNSTLTIGIPDPDFDEFNTQDSETIYVNELFSLAGQKLNYIYDFGDSWVHQLKLEKITDDKLLKADVLNGKGACPPEDCGGVHGYMQLKELMLNPKDPEYKSTRAWLGLKKNETWDADLFDLEKAWEAVREV